MCYVSVFLLATNQHIWWSLITETFFVFLTILSQDRSCGYVWFKFTTWKQTCVFWIFLCCMFAETMRCARCIKGLKHVKKGRREWEKVPESLSSSIETYWSPKQIQRTTQPHSTSITRRASSHIQHTTLKNQRVEFWTSLITIKHKDSFHASNCESSGAMFKDFNSKQNPPSKQICFWSWKTLKKIYMHLCFSKDNKTQKHPALNGVRPDDLSRRERGCALRNRLTLPGVLFLGSCRLFKIAINACKLLDFRLSTKKATGKLDHGAFFLSECLAVYLSVRLPTTQSTLSTKHKQWALGITLKKRSQMPTNTTENSLFFAPLDFHPFGHLAFAAPPAPSWTKVPSSPNERRSSARSCAAPQRSCCFFFGAIALA